MMNLFEDDSMMNNKYCICTQNVIVIILIFIRLSGLGSRILTRCPNHLS